MKRILVLLAVITLAIACNNGEKKASDQGEKAEEVKVVHTVALKDFDEKAGEHVDAEIVTKGIVDHVCRHGGKKLFLVDDNADIHVEGEERFNEDLMGSEIEVRGIVREFRVDEGYCLQMEEDAIKSHSEGESTDEMLEHKKADIAYYRDSMNVAGVDHLSYYTLEYVSHKELKAAEKTEEVEEETEEKTAE